VREGQNKKNLALIGQCGSEGRSGLVRTQKKVTLKKSERSEKKMREGKDSLPERARTGCRKKVC